MQDPRAYGAPDFERPPSAPAQGGPAGGPLPDPDVASPTSAAGREGGGSLEAGAAQQTPPTGGAQAPRQNRSPPVDEA